MIKLYDYWRSSAAYRARIGLNLKGVGYEAIAVNILPGVDEHFRPEFRAKNAQARVPALETEQGMMSQSLAMLEWLDETHPEPPLLPGDAWARAQIRAFALTIACDIHPLNNTSAIGRLKSQFGADDAGVGSWYVHWIKLGFEALEEQAAQRPQSKFAFGDAPTLADVCLVPQMANARRFKFDFTKLPRLVAFDEHARAHPAFVKAAPENQADAVKPT